MVWEDSRRVFYSEFQGAVRKFEPLGLLRYLAAESTKLKEFEGFDPDWATVAPWAISGIAREAILSAPRNRGFEVDRRGFVRLLNLYRGIDIIPPSGLQLYPFMVGITHSQSSYQTSAKEDVARPMAIYLESPINKVSRSRDELDALVNAPFEDLAHSTFVLWALARSSSGVIRKQQIADLWAEAPDRLPSLESMLGTLDRLTATLAEATADGLNAPQLRDGLQKYGYNPLSLTPFIELDDGSLCAPQTQLILRSCSLESLYYLGQKKWPGVFGTELGHRMESYVGRQLNHTGRLRVVPEFDTGKGKKSVDWFLITPEAVILIECKSAHMTLEARAGTALASESVAGKLAIAYKQIRVSAEGIRSGDSHFGQVPNDRPLVGVIVTAEPVYMMNADEVRDEVDDPGVPVIGMSLRDLEDLATWDEADIGRLILQVATDPSVRGYDFHNSIRQLDPGRVSQRNSLVDETFQKYIPIKVP